jgi:hypothetical protein
LRQLTKPEQEHLRMTPEDSQKLQVYLEAVAAILYHNSEPEQLKTLEGIEQAVRQQVLEHVSPQIGVFLSKKQQQQQQLEIEN